MPFDKYNVQELDKTRLFDGSIIKTCMKKEHIAVVASVKQTAELRSHRITGDGSIYARMPQAPRTWPHFDLSEGRILGYLHHLKPSFADNKPF